MNKIEFYSNLAKFQGRNGDAFLKHYGIIGQKWGTRRWQHADGTFNEEGKQRYFGAKTKIGSNNDETKKQEKINKKVERQVKNKLKEIKWHNKSPFSKKIDISEDALKKYYQAYYDLPWYKRTTKNINNAYLKRFSENVDENTQKGIKKIDDEKNMMLLNQHMQQINQMNEINRINNEINQINQINMINQINQMNQMSMMPGFMGKSSKLKNRYQYENGCLSEEYIEKAQKLANEGKWDELEKLKKKVDFDKVQEWAKKANPDLYKKSELGDPSEYEGDYESYVEDNWEVAAKKRGFDPDNLTNEQSKIIDKDMKDYFNKNEEKVGSIFNKTPEEKEFKEAKRLTQQLNFNNGTRILKELNNTEYGKKHIQPIYNKYEENMNELSDKAEKIIKDNPVDEIEAGIASAIDHNGGVPNIGYIINNVRRQHHANTVDSFINVDSLPLLKSEEDLYTEAKEYKKEFGENIEKAIKDINPKANITLSSLAALTNYENDKLEKVYNMNGEDYRRYQLYQTINYGLVPEANKEIIRKNIVEPTKKLYPKVEKLFKNTNVGDPTYDWSDIGKALVKLGLDNKPADELTNADWKKVYEICSQ